MKMMLVCLFLLLMVASCHEGEGRQVPRIIPKAAADVGNEDRLLLDIRFGMSFDAFKQYCWQMNARGLFTNGNGNHSVAYNSDSAFRSPVTWRFFPVFREQKIVALKAVLNYDAYSPWNRQMDAKSLMQDVLAVLSRWYGPNDLHLAGGGRTPKRLVRTDGYREISIRPVSEKDVQVDFRDLRVPENTNSYGPSL